MKKPRLTDMDRHNIESMLKEGSSVYAIAKALSRPVTFIEATMSCNRNQGKRGNA